MARSNPSANDGCSLLNFDYFFFLNEVSSALSEKAKRIFIQLNNNTGITITGVWANKAPRALSIKASGRFFSFSSISAVLLQANNNRLKNRGSSRRHRRVVKRSTRDKNKYYRYCNQRRFEVIVVLYKFTWRIN